MKLTCSVNKFGELLRISRNAKIVEKFSKDRFWGAVPFNDDYLQGQNVIGALIARLRQEWVVGQEIACEVEPPEYISKTFC